MPFVILAEAGTHGRDVHVDERCRPPSSTAHRPANYSANVSRVWRASPPSAVIPAQAGIHTR